MPTSKEKQIATEQFIRQLIASPSSFKGNTLSEKRYDFFHIDPQTDHTLFSALVKTGHYAAAKNILKRLPEKAPLYNSEQDDRVMRFCRFEKCGPMLRFLKAPSRRAMALAQIPFKTRNELTNIAQLIKTRLSLFALEEWTDGGRPWRDTMTSGYTGAAATAQALEDEEEERYERYQKNEQNFTVSLTQTLHNATTNTATPTTEAAPVSTPTPAPENISTSTPLNKKNKPAKIDNDRQTNFEHLLFSKQHTGRE